MDPTDQPMLAFEGGPDEAKTVGLGGTTTLGREPTNDVVVTEPGASRQHAEIVESDDGFRLRDLNSTNGTFVNDRRVRGRDHLLKDGDRIRLGSTETSLVFRLPAAIEEKPDPSQGEPQPAAPAPVGPAEEEIGADTLAEKVSEGPVPPSVAAPLEAEPAEAVPPAPSRTGLAGLMHRIALGIKLKRSRAPEAPSSEVDTTPQVSLPLLTRMSRAVRNLGEEFDLRRRRRTFALSEEAGIVRVVVFEGQEIVAWGTVDPREGDPFQDDAAAQPAEADEESAPALQSAAQEPGSQPGQEQAPTPDVDKAPDADAPAPDVDDAPDVDAPVSEEDDSSGQSDEDRYVIGAIGSLMEELRAKPARLVTDLPLYIPLVRHLKLPPLRRRFLEPVLISEVTGAIPFGEHEVDIKWHAVKDGKSATALAIAVQKEVVDSHVRRMKEAGKGPTATYSQAAALGLAAGVSDAMIVHLTSDRESVVLVRDGVPQVVLQVWSPEGTSLSEDRAEAMARAVEQMEGYDQTLGASAGDERLPLVLTGEVPGDDQLADELRQMLQREVLPLAPPLDLPEGFPVAEYATTVGLGLLDRSRPRPWRKATSDNLAALNLLSERHLPTPIPVRAIAVFALMAIFAVAAVLLTPTVTARENERDVKSVVLDKVETEERDHRLEAGAAASLERKAREKRQLTLDLSLKLDGIQADIDELGEWFNKIETITQKSRPPNVSVSNLAPKEDRFTLSGRAQTFAEAVRYATNICKSGLFVDVSLQQVGSAGAPLVFGQTELGLLEAVCDSTEASTTAPLLVSEGADEVGGTGLDFVIEATTRPPPGEETDDESEEGQGG